MRRLMLGFILGCTVVAKAQVFGVSETVKAESDEDLSLQRSVDTTGQHYFFSLWGKAVLEEIKFAHQDCTGNSPNKQDWAVLIRVRGPKAGHVWTAVLNSTSCHSIHRDEPSWKPGDLIRIAVSQITDSPSVPKVFTDDSGIYRLEYGEQNKKKGTVTGLYR